MTKPERERYTWDKHLRAGTGPVQDEFLELARSTRVSRHYCPDCVGRPPDRGLRPCGAPAGRRLP